MKLTQEYVVKEIKNGRSLRDFPEWVNNKKVVLAAVKISGWNLEFASDRLRDDKEVVLEGVKKVGWVVRFSSERLKDDKDVVLRAVEYSGYNLQYVSERLKNDEDVVLEAMKKGGLVLQYVSSEIKDRIGNNNPVQFLERWIKNKKQQEWLNRQLDKKENKGKIKI